MANFVCWVCQLNRLRTRLGSVLNVAVVLTSDEAADAIDDKLVETTVDFVKQNAVLNNQLEVNTNIPFTR